MANEKYVNYYIEVLTSTLNDCVIRNVSMQANAKITDDVIEEQTGKIEQLTELINQRDETIKLLKDNNALSENNIINDLRNKIVEKDAELSRLSNVVNELNTKYRDYDSIKGQTSHLETFKNELIKAREEIVNARNENKTELENLTKKHEAEKNDLLNQIVDLNAKIDFLQLSPAKRKKISELNKGDSPILASAVIEDDNAKDGGMF
jgi:DNA repair exonuclease SbcCD ATPase subunit